MSTSPSAGMASPGGSQWDRLEWDLRTKNITDHDGNTVNLLWSVPPGLQTSADYSGPFPFPIYFTKGAVHSANDDKFHSDFVRLMEAPRNLSADPIVICSRFEFYTKPFPSILACIAHQRREISHRNRNGVFPRLISDWSEGGGDHEGVILVVDRDDCLSSGVILVHFDAEAYKLGRRDERWYLPDDIPDVEAIRHPIEIGQTGRGLAWELESCYRQAGGTWTEDDLQRRNDGATSPVLYPAIDPDAHHDVEHEAVHELDGTALRPPGDTTENEGEGEDEDEDDDGPAKIIDLFDRRELFMRDTELPHLDSESYTDLFDQPVTSVWDRRISKTRPDFCFTLYLSYDVLPLRPKALFTCLNKGLLADSAWTLDVVTNMPSLEATFDYHSRNATLRSPAKSKSRASCVRLILDRINGKRLPAELLDLIEHQLVPPEIPNYSSRPLRPHQNLFMYLDHSHLSTGPFLVYSKEMDLRLDRTIRHHIHHSVEKAELDQRPLHILFLRFWHRIADELHNLWSTCSPRLLLPEDMTPTISLRITLFNLARWQQSVIGEETAATTHAHVALRSDFHRPITIHLHPLFSHDLFSEALDLIDLSSGETLPFLPPTRSSHDKGDSWQQNRALGFHRGHTPEDHSMNTLHPGKWENILFLGGTKRLERWIPERRDAGLLREGQEYALRLRDNVTIPRWTYGAVEEREGPYNLPPLRVRMDGDVEFKYEVEAVLTDREGVDGPTALSQG